ncbi:MAG: methyltransferase domain-containing protein [Alphaproteobacteria bacterium]|nr:methyltransferase domain-containing protein [Alphaproteobacteria bacterium]
MAESSKLNQGVDTRVAATHVLAAVFDKHQTIDEALDKVGAKYRLSDADRRLVHAISGFVFRNLGFIDQTLLTVMNRKRAPSPKLLHQLLRVGVAQLMYMDVAEHAAVHATVSACGSLHLSRQKGLVNAVLRSVQRQRQQLLAKPSLPLDTLPEWLRNRWISTYGESVARDLATAMKKEAPIDVCVKDANALLQWGQQLGGECIGIQSVRMPSDAAHIVSWHGFEDGAWWIQDIAATLPINMLGEVSGKSVLDMCAAPGGKSMQLAAKGAKVTALDVSAARMQRVLENIARCKLEHEVKTVVADATTWCADSEFDIVVLDAPCSSTGTLRRHPELPWNHDKNQLEKTCASQRLLLKRASNLLRSQGYLLYCTCSLEVEEGENQIEAFLAENSNFKEIAEIPLPVQPYLKRGLKGIGWRAYPTLLASRGGMDGFFIALLQKQ